MTGCGACCLSGLKAGGLFVAWDDSGAVEVVVRMATVLLGSEEGCNIDWLNGYELGGLGGWLRG